MSYKILVSNGEILDKLSILNLKQKFCKNKYQLNHISDEINQISVIANDILQTTELYILYDKLKLVNQTLWEIEDLLRIKENKQEFDDKFIQLARQVYINNDQRASIKKDINIISNSLIVEEKVYEKY